MVEGAGGASRQGEQSLEHRLQIALGARVRGLQFGDLLDDAQAALLFEQEVRIVEMIAIGITLFLMKKIFAAMVARQFLRFSIKMIFALIMTWRRLQASA